MCGQQSTILKRANFESIFLVCNSVRGQQGLRSDGMNRPQPTRLKRMKLKNILF